MQRQNGQQVTAKQFLFNCDPALKSVVAKEALQWRKGNITQVIKTRQMSLYIVLLKYTNWIHIRYIIILSDNILILSYLHNYSQEDLIWRHKGKIHLLKLINLTVSAIEKLQALEKQWSCILYEIISNTLSDFSEMDLYMKRCNKTLENNK